METTGDSRLTLFDKSVFEMFVHPDEVIELRVPRFYGKVPGTTDTVRGATVTGVFDAHDLFCEALRALDQQRHDGAYVTLQVIDPRLIARSCNRVKVAGLTTADSNVLFYRWLPIDIDPARPSGISSSATELEKALALRDLVEAWIEQTLRLPSPIRAMSGNGAHLLYRLPDLPATKETQVFIKSTLEGLALRFNSDSVKIDTTVFNAGRVWKAYGSTSKKGDELPENEHREARPHRMAFIEDIGDCNA